VVFKKFSAAFGGQNIEILAKMAIWGKIWEIWENFWFFPLKIVIFRVQNFLELPPPLKASQVPPRLSASLTPPPPPPLAPDPRPCMYTMSFPHIWCYNLIVVCGRCSVRHPVQRRALDGRHLRLQRRQPVLHPGAAVLQLPHLLLERAVLLLQVPDAGDQLLVLQVLQQLLLLRRPHAAVAQPVAAEGRVVVGVAVVVQVLLVVDLEGAAVVELSSRRLAGAVLYQTGNMVLLPLPVNVTCIVENSSRRKLLPQGWAEGV
jgi:hypothetical protein